MGNKHALLSASSSARWLACPPSALLCSKVKDVTSTYAQQGTEAHSLCEYKVRKMLGEDVEDPTPSLEFYDEEMETCTDDYLTFVNEELSGIRQTCKDPLVLVEQRLDFSDYVPDGFGTGDCVIVSDNVLEVIDFKYGLGVLVSANDNPQMKLYALGALEMFGSLYDVDKIRMAIFQPRRENVSICEISKSELLDWSENELKPKALLASKGEGEFKAGEHCKFCKIKATCRKRAEYNLELAKYDFKVPAQLTDTEISGILDSVDNLVSWAEDVKEYALKQALQGVKFEGYKLVEGRSTRRYTDENMVISAVEKEGLDPYEHRILGITAMEKLLGKKKFNELLGGLVYKPKGKPALVKESDRRAELITDKAAEAANDFKEDN